MDPYAHDWSWDRPIPVAVASGNKLWVAAMASLLHEDPLRITAVVGGGASLEALSALIKAQWSAGLIVDLSTLADTPPGGFLELRRVQPNLGFVVLGERVALGQWLGLLRSGGVALIAAGPHPWHLRVAIQTAVYGFSTLGPGILGSNGAVLEMPPLTPDVNLSEREIEVLGDLSRGLSERESARRMAVSERAVQEAIRRARQKLGARSRAHAVALALQLGRSPMLELPS